MVTYEQVKASDEINAYIQQADKSLSELGYTEHYLPHVMRCAEVASSILLQLGFSEREAELAKIAGYMHDIGNVINRDNHAQTGALMAFRILDKMGMSTQETGKIITAIGYHDEKAAYPDNEIAAALILADKTDVRRTRVRNSETINFDIHDRVNFAAEKGELKLDSDAKTLSLFLTIDTEICPVADYFEIFLNRMMLCKRAADKLSLTFKLIINDAVLI